MTQTLKVDPEFCPSAGRDGDELFANGIFVFNITRMLEYLQATPSNVDPVEIDVRELSPAFSRINESALESVDLTHPVILAEIAPGRYNLIDGHHRVEKARRVGVNILKAYELSALQHIAFLTSKKAYLSYVEYWNSKLR